MKKLLVVLTLAMAVVWSGCGSSSAPAPVAYVARASSNSWAPQLFIFDPTKKTSTAVTIPIPASAEYVSSNSDATKVVYTFDGDNGWDIFSMGTDGQATELTTGADAWEPTFSPDGKTVAYMVYNGSYYQLFTMSADGSGQAAFYADASNLTSYYSPMFSPDGKSLVFYVYYSGGPAAAGMPMVGPHDTHVSSRLQSQASHAQSSHVAPRAQAAGAPTQNGWYTMALTDSNPTLVYATTNNWGPATFSSDGSKLLLTIYDGTQWNISSVKLDGTGLTPLTTSTDAQNFGPISAKSIILFNRYNSANSSADIYVMDQTGANQKVVSTSAANTWESLIDTFWEND